MKRYCLDASALFLYLTSGEENHDLEGVFADINDGKAEGIISTVTMAEFHRAIMRAFSREKADLYVSWLRESKISIISTDQKIGLSASSLKQRYAKARSPFAWGDAFCLATAIHTNCDVLVTMDSEFDKVDDIKIMKV